MLSLSAVLVALASNLDNLAVGFSLGIGGKQVGLLPNSIIAAITMAGTGAALIGGQELSQAAPAEVGTAVGASIVIAIGAWTLIDSRLPLAHSSRPWRLSKVYSVGDETQSALALAGTEVSWRQAIPLGVALSVNNLGAGLGAGVAHVQPLSTTLLAGAISLLCVGGGSRAGWSTGARLSGNRASFLAGLLLIGVGAAMLSGAG